jgi:hypothetical protein
MYGEWVMTARYCTILHNASGQFFPIIEQVATLVSGGWMQCGRDGLIMRYSDSQHSEHHSW